MDELISKQAALDAVNIANDNGQILTILDVLDVIKALPPVQPKHGRWIEIKNKKGVVIAIKCDKCSQFPKHGVRSDFCPNCGADMRGDEKRYEKQHL